MNHDHRIFWAKTSKSGEAYHPVIFHLIDVGVSAYIWLRQQSPDYLNRLSKGLGLSEDHCIELISFLCAAHDIGKINPGFQGKNEIQAARLLEIGYKTREEDERFKHGSISYFILMDYLKSRVKSSQLHYYKSIIAAIAGHHGKYPMNALFGNTFDARLLGNEQWISHQRQCLSDLMSLFDLEELPPINRPSNTVLIQIAGLCTRVDWIGSSEYNFPRVNADTPLLDYYSDAWNKARKAVYLSSPLRSTIRKPEGLPFNQVFPFEPRPAQVIAEKIAKTNWSAVVIEAPMGDGKTEMALYLMRDLLAKGKRGFYFALPTQATSNSMYDRIESFLHDSGESIEVHLLHNRSEFIDRYVHERSLWQGNKESNAWLADNTKLKLLMNQGVGTLDQILTGVLFTKHGPLRLHSMEDKVIILDEIHAYDAYTTSILERFLEWMRALGCCVIMLSATLPESNRNRLLRTYAGKKADIPKGDYPSVTWIDDTGVHAQTFDARKQSNVFPKYIQSLDEDIDIAAMSDEAVKMASMGAKVAVICNTVSRAQEAYRMIRSRFDDTMIFHARMPFAYRMEREQEVLTTFGKSSSLPVGSGKILVATQVVEQSLDIDFDAMITELCPVDMLLQRTGRLHRHDKPRPEGFEAPILHICVPRIVEGSRFASVMPYDLFLQYRTYACIKDREVISIPDDVYELVQYVYEEDSIPVNPLFGDHYLASKTEYQSKQNSRCQQAQGLIIESPKSQNNVLHCLKGLVADEKAVQITTRLALESIQAVLLFQNSDGTVYPIDRPDLSFSLSQEKPSRALTNAILNGSVSLNNKKIVDHFKQIPQFPAFEDHAVLRPVVPIILRQTPQGWMNIDSKTSIRLDQETGIVLTSATSPS